MYMYVHIYMYIALQINRYMYVKCSYNFRNHGFRCLNCLIPKIISMGYRLFRWQSPPPPPHRIC